MKAIQSAGVDQPLTTMANIALSGRCVYAVALYTTNSKTHCLLLQKLTTTMNGLTYLVKVGLFVSVGRFMPESTDVNWRIL